MRSATPLLLWSKRPSKSTGGAIAWQLDEQLRPERKQARAVVEGAILGDDDPGAWKTGEREGASVSQWTPTIDDDVAGERQVADTARWTNWRPGIC